MPNESNLSSPYSTKNLLNDGAADINLIKNTSGTTIITYFSFLTFLRLIEMQSTVEKRRKFNILREDRCSGCYDDDDLVPAQRFYIKKKIDNQHKFIDERHKYYHNIRILNTFLLQCDSA